MIKWCGLEIGARARENTGRIMPGTYEALALSLVLRKMNPEVMLGLPCLKAFRQQSTLPLACF